MDKLKSLPVSQSIDPSSFNNYAELEKEGLYKALVNSPELLKELKQKLKKGVSAENN